MITYITRTHKINISRSHKYFKIIDQASFKAKNLYNSALYIERQQYFKNKDLKSFINNFTLYSLLKETNDFKELHSINSQLPQQTLKLLYQNITAFKKSLKSYFKDPSRFNTAPKLPRYKHKTKGRCILDFNYNSFSLTPFNPRVIKPPELTSPKLKAS